MEALLAPSDGIICISICISISISISIVTIVSRKVCLTKHYCWVFAVSELMLQNKIKLKKHDYDAAMILLEFKRKIDWKVRYFVYTSNYECCIKARDIKHNCDTDKTAFKKNVERIIETIELMDESKYQNTQSSDGIKAIIIIIIVFLYKSRALLIC